MPGQRDTYGLLKSRWVGPGDSNLTATACVQRVVQRFFRVCAPCVGGKHASVQPQGRSHMAPGLSQNGPRAYFGILSMRYARQHRAKLALVLEAIRFFSLARFD